MEGLLQEQIQYYRARAGEYDEWFLRLGRYDRGAEHNKVWFREVDEVARELESLEAVGSVLEIAAGTGIWTQHLVKTARSLTALDSSLEVLSLNRERVNNPKVVYLQADIFAWEPSELYDLVCFSFWLSHVPLDMFQLFWEKVKRALKPEGRVFFLDSKFDRTSTAVDHILKDKDEGIVDRRLNDGREFRIVKVFHEPEELTKRLLDLGWRAEIRETHNYFYFGTAAPT